jgi:hypothetical protein
MFVRIGGSLPVFFFLNFMAYLTHLMQLENLFLPEHSSVYLIAMFLTPFLGEFREGCME